jgi:paraquat-inducible protein B
LGNLLLFIVFNTLARLDVDFKGPHGETRLDFGEMKRSFKRWLKKQLGQTVEEPEKVVLNPKVSLDLSLGNNLTLRREQQLLNTLNPTLKKQQPQQYPFSLRVSSVDTTQQQVAPLNPSYLEQSIQLFQPALFQKQPDEQPVLAGGLLP